MSSNLELPEGPDPVIAVAARIRADAQSFHDKAGNHLDKINSLESEAPWGDDRTGRSFYGSYTKPTEQGKPGNVEAHDVAEHAGEDGISVGDNIITAMSSYRATDLDSSYDIGRLGRS